MTGHNTGAVACIERKLQKPLQRGVCFLHHLEKPFEYLFAFHDGKTSGPRTFDGPIGKAIEQSDLHELEVSEFESVPNEDLLNQINEIPKDEYLKFSRDFQWGIGVAKIVITGDVSDWAPLKCGNIHQARWWNREMRVLRYFLSCSEPSPALKRLVNYIHCECLLACLSRCQEIWVV